MRNLKLPVLFLVGAMLLLTGCPYQSKVPITAPDSPINEKFLGFWKNKEDGEEHDEVLEFQKKDANRYLLIKHSVAEEGEEADDPDYYEVHISIVDGQMFFNARKDRTTEGFYLYRVSWDGNDKFIQEEVTDNIEEEFDSSDELMAFIDKYQDLSFFYNNDEKQTWYRTDKSALDPR